MKSIVAEEIDATFGSAGTLEAHVRMTLRGDHELRARTIFRSIPAAVEERAGRDVGGPGHDRRRQFNSAISTDTQCLFSHPVLRGSPVVWCGHV
jgi:hypothetical protein